MSAKHFDPLDPIGLKIKEDFLWIVLADDRVIKIPLNDLLWLQNATPEQQQDYQLLEQTILWDSLDEGLDTEEMSRIYPVLETHEV